MPIDKMISKTETLIYTSGDGVMVTYEYHNENPPMGFLIISTIVVDEVNLEYPTTLSTDVRIKDIAGLVGPSASTRDFSMKVHGYVDVGNVESYNWGKSLMSTGDSYGKKVANKGRKGKRGKK